MSTAWSHRSFRAWTMERRVELALAVERAARERDPLVSNVEDTVYADSEGRAALATSNGFCASFEQTQCYAYAYAFAGEGADRMTGIGLAVARGPDGIEPEEVGAEAADRAVALHGARQPRSRRCPVVLDPHVAASFASVIGRTLSADAVQRGRSLFAGKEGEQIADPALRLLDDGLDPEGLATAPFDGEGIPQQRTALIENGRLRHLSVRCLHRPQGGARVDRQRHARVLPGAAGRRHHQSAGRPGQRDDGGPDRGGR